MSEENTRNITKSNNLFAPTFFNRCILPDVTFNGHCLIKIIFLSLKSYIYIYIYIYISYTLNQWPRDLNTDFALGNWSVKLTKNADLDKYVYPGYGIGFELRSEFSR